ncbi:MAG: transposase [Elusimicrobiota bacterium]
MLYHVIGRGLEQKKIFANNTLKQEFYKRFSNILSKSSIQCYAWCIMDNHFHFLIQTGTTKLSHFMSRLLTGYAIYYNKKHKRRGHLFENRYKSILCEKDKYLFSLVRYIHLNPVKAKIISYETLKDYLWTGHHEFFTTQKGIVNKDDLLEHFGDSRKKALKQYKQYILDGLNLEENFDKITKNLENNQENVLFDNRILGRADFVQSIVNKIENNENIALRKMTLQDLENCIKNYYNIDKKMLFKNMDRKLKDYRTLYIYLGNTYLGKSLTDIGLSINLNRSSVSMIMTRCLNDDKILKMADKVIKAIF